MIRRTLFSLGAVVLLGMFAACGDNDGDATTADTTAAADFTDLDRTWDADDSLFLADYDSARVAYDRQSAAQSADTTVSARIAAHNQALQDLETRRIAAREKREAARAAKDRAAYEAARAEADYQAWRADLQRIRAEQAEIEGMISIGDKKVGGVDVNAAPGNQDKPLIRVEPGEDDDKPLIEKNKNP
ncbi:MAG TPA: hypothetical protein VNA88_12720 [Candidatus Kapabacteria bacterium]|nr:hypothetical protein [Candidatus Kapabacteria bacterium]